MRRRISFGEGGASGVHRWRLFRIPMNATFRDTVLGFVLSLTGVGLALMYARRAGIIDIPNLRSSHRIPTPRGGGIAFVASVVAVGAFSLGSYFARGVGLALTIVWVALTALALVGWADDRRDVPVAFRLPLHLACGCAVAFLVNTVAPTQGVINAFWLTWWVFWTVASINIVNFMDGIDGMIAAQGVVYGIFLFALQPPGSPSSRFALILAAASFGFLFWNWAPAKIFMGDAGSGPLGMMFAVGGALAIRDSRAALVFLPLFPLFLDALVTLVRRSFRGEKLTDAHRNHLYQRIANRWNGHALVSSAYALAAAIGAAVAVIVRDATALRVAGAAIGYLIVVGLAWSAADAKYQSAPPF